MILWLIIIEIFCVFQISIVADFCARGNTISCLMATKIDQNGQNQACLKLHFLCFFWTVFGVCFCIVCTNSV